MTHLCPRCARQLLSSLTTCQCGWGVPINTPFSRVSLAEKEGYGSKTHPTQDNTDGVAATPADIETLVVEYAKASKFALDAYTKGYRHAELALRAELAARPDPIGAAWMREQAANTVAYSERLISEDNRIWIDERPYVCEETTYRAIRAIPLPTDAELLAEAMKLPEVAALVDASDALGFWMSAALEDPKVCDEMKAVINVWFSAIAPFTAAKETP